MGQVGLIKIPSAEAKKEQSVYFTSTKSNFDKLGILTVTPFDWFEASYYYYRPDDLMWGAAQGKYLDKGFNFKLLYSPNNDALPKIAIGLDDFAGTGQFSKEYIVSTYGFEKFKLTTGIGWGKFVGKKNTIRNPLGSISNSFYSRPETSKNYDRGGQLSYDKLFKGEAVIFGGIEIPFGKNSNYSLKIESNPFDYFKFSCCGEGISSDSIDLRKSDANFNYGISYKIGEFGNIDLSYIKGNTLNLSISIGFSSKSPLRKKRNFEPEIKNNEFNQNKQNEFYYDLLDNLNRNKIYLQTADLKQNNLSITVDPADLVNPIQYSSRAAFIASEVAYFNQVNLTYIDIGYITRGAEINNISYKNSDIQSNKTPVALIKKRTVIKNIDPNNYRSDEFRPRVNFPVILNSIDPDIRTHVGSPERFLFYGFGIKLSSEVQFNRNLTFKGVVGQSLYDNFDQKISCPCSQLENVRTEIVSYLQKSDELYIKNLQLDYIKPIKKNIYGRISGGYLEEMYGGISSEILYKPFDSNLAISIELNNIRKREYDGRFKFKNFKTMTYHLNTAFYEQNTNILLKWSYGKYLAGDEGYTLDISRRMPSGWQAGFYFTRTNVSAEQFGEGSFDKAFYFKIPFNVFQKEYSKNSINFGLKTMTRDGGQKLVIENRLIDSFYGATKNEINENWLNYLK